MVLITRADLAPGYQSVQPAHALAEFAIQYPDEFREWQVNYKNLIVLSVKNQSELFDLASKFASSGVKFCIFTEPDIKNEITAICAEPNEITYKLTQKIPLALKE